jgi:hypothetical protein
VLLEGVGTSAATLTGLLFVAVSVSETHAKSHPVVRAFRAAAALLAFINALAVSLFGLVPGNNIGYPAAILGVIGILFTAAGLRTIGALNAPQSPRRTQLALVAALLLTFGVELAYGIVLILNTHRAGAVATIGDVLIASLLLGIARAWELVGGWNAGIWSSIALLTGHESRLGTGTDDRSTDDDGPE